VSPPDPRLARYLARGHRAVQGWCSDVGREFAVRVDAVQRQGGVAGHVAEIGVHHGKLFILLMLLRRPGERGVAVDVFEQVQGNVDGSGKGDEAVFRRNLRRHAGGDMDVRVLRGDSRTFGAADLIGAAGGLLRLFSVDGGHTAEIVRHDLNTAAYALAPGGVIILDDYFNPEWPAVSEGTCRFLEGPDNPGLVPFALGGNKVLFTTGPEPAARYLEAFLEQGFAWEHKVTTFFGHRVVSVSHQRPGVLRRLTRSPFWRRFRESPLGRAARRLSG